MGNKFDELHGKEAELKNLQAKASIIAKAKAEALERRDAELGAERV